MAMGADTRPAGRPRRRSLAAGAALGLVLVPALSLLTASAAAAAAPALVQSAAGQGSSSSTGATVAITATLPAPCTSGDTLVAMVSVSEQVGVAGQVTATPAGWRRLYEHAPSDTAPPTTISPYQGWFALPGCSGVQSATFSVTASGDTAGTAGSVVLSEFSGLPNPVAEDFSTNSGSSTAATSASLSGETPAASGELVLSALSFYGSSPTSTTPSGWTAAGTETGTVPAYTYWQTSSTSVPSASFTWSPSSAYELTMLALKAGPPAGAPDVVQENQGTFSSQSSWGVTLPDAVGAGDALVALIGTSTSGSTGAGYEATAVSGGGVTWQKVTGFIQSGNGTAEVWAGFSSTWTAGATPVTATMSGSLTGHMEVSEVSGIDAVDTSSTNTGTSAAPTGTSITPTAGDFLVGMLAANNTAVWSHPQPDWSTYSLSASSYAAEWQSNVPATASAPQWATQASSAWVTVQAAFLAGSSSSTTPVGTFVNSSGTGVTTLAVAPAHVGDCFILVVKASTTTTSVSSVAGGGATGWRRLSSVMGTTADVEEWLGTITSTGSSTVTVSFSASVASVLVELSAQEFSSGLGTSTVWTEDTGAGQNNTSSTTVAFPTLATAASAELYVGYARVDQTGAAGATPGFTYDITSLANIFCYDPDVTGAVAPTASQAPAGTSQAVGLRQVHHAVGLRHAHPAHELPQRRRRHAAPPLRRNGRHTRIVPAGHVPIAHQRRQHAFR